MPKRVPTPPPADDYKYLTVCYPYPLYANMTIEDERKAFAHWVTAALEGDMSALIALFYKPSAPNAVIIEISKSCKRIDALLGLHRWSEFLCKPTQEEKDMETRVFYCHYSSGRQVQKSGWRRFDVWDNWFDNFNPRTCPFIFDPYPQSRFCEVPPEIQKDNLCRPLPVALFPFRKQGAARFIGTDGRSDTASVVGTGVRSPSVAGSIATTSPPSSIAHATNVWSGKPWSKASSTASSVVGSEWPHMKALATSDSTATKAKQTPKAGAIGPPPGLPPPSGRSFTGSNERGRTAARTSDNWDMSSGESSPSPSADEVEIILNHGKESSITAAGTAVKRAGHNNRSSRSDSISSSASASRSGSGSAQGFDRYPVLDGYGYEEEEDEEEAELAASLKASFAPTNTSNGTAEDGDAPTEDFWAEGCAPARPADWDKTICPEHQIACRVGICRVMAKIEKDKKRLESQREKEQKRANKDKGNGKNAKEGKKGERRGGGYGRGGGTGTGGWRSNTRDAPPSPTRFRNLANDRDNERDSYNIEEYNAGEGEGTEAPGGRMKMRGLMHIP